MTDRVIGRIERLDEDGPEFWCDQCAKEREGHCWGLEYRDGEYEGYLCRACLTEIRDRITAALEADR